MPGLSFMPRFAPLVESGQKRQTIRKVRKRPIKVGDTLYLWEAQRTPARRYLGEVVCTSVDELRIAPTRAGGVVQLWHSVDFINYAEWHPRSRRTATRIAQADGLTDFAEMVSLFNKIHGLPFEGVLIRWDAPPSRESDR